MRSGAVGTTSLNYTGQRLDGTGLLYYHARYYDPNLARFVSADSVVPGNASGGMDGVALKGLTVDFHEPGFVGQIAGENNLPFWFQLSDDDRGKVGSPWGPSNPQALNRYAYVQNNPLGATDPSGHLGVTFYSWGGFTLGRSVLNGGADTTDQRALVRPWIGVRAGVAAPSVEAAHGGEASRPLSIRVR